MVTGCAVSGEQDHASAKHSFQLSVKLNATLIRKLATDPNFFANYPPNTERSTARLISIYTANKRRIAQLYPDGTIKM